MYVISINESIFIFVHAVRSFSVSTVVYTFFSVFTSIRLFIVRLVFCLFVRSCFHSVVDLTAVPFIMKMIMRWCHRWFTFEHWWLFYVSSPISLPVFHTDNLWVSFFVVVLCRRSSVCCCCCLFVLCFTANQFVRLNLIFSFVLSLCDVESSLDRNWAYFFFNGRIKCVYLLPYKISVTAVASFIGRNQSARKKSETKTEKKSKLTK